jgi:hypothetical protein
MFLQEIGACKRTCGPGLGNLPKPLLDPPDLIIGDLSPTREFHEVEQYLASLACGFLSGCVDVGDP